MPPLPSHEHDYYPHSPLGQRGFLDPPTTGVYRAAHQKPTPQLELESAASHNPALFAHAQHDTQTQLSFQQSTQPKAQESLFGKRKGWGGAWEAACRLTFSLLLGDHWRWLRKGLAYLTIGSRVGGCWRAKEERREQDTVTVTRRETG